MHHHAIAHLASHQICTTDFPLKLHRVPRSTEVRKLSTLTQTACTSTSTFHSSIQQAHRIRRLCSVFQLLHTASHSDIPKYTYTYLCMCRPAGVFACQKWDRPLHERTEVRSPPQSSLQNKVFTAFVCACVCEAVVLCWPSRH